MFSINIPEMSDNTNILHSISSTGTFPTNSYQSTSGGSELNPTPIPISNIVDQFGDPNDSSDDNILKKEITSKFLTTYYVTEIKENLDGKKKWASIGEYCGIGYKLVFLSSGTFTLVEAYYKTNQFTLVSGVLTFFATGILAFSSYSYKKSENKRRSANVLLKTLNLSEIPNDSSNDNSDDSETTSKKTIVANMK